MIFCFHDDNESEAVEAHIPRHRDSKTKKPRHRDSKTKKLRHRNSKTKKPRHWETETNKPRNRDSKAFFQRTKSHDIDIPRLKNDDIKIPRPKSNDIEFLWNSDPYTPWYFSLASIFIRAESYQSDKQVRESYLKILLEGTHMKMKILLPFWLFLLRLHCWLTDAAESTTEWKQSALAGRK